MSIIKTEGLGKIYKLGKTFVSALKNVRLEFEKVDIACIMGPSGAGKSTLLNLIGCLDRPTSGKVLINGIQTINLNDDNLSLFRNKYYRLHFSKL